MRDFVSQLQGGLIVSCQAYPGEPMRHPETMAQIALSAQLGGAAGIRCQGLADISAVKGQVSVPVIGLWKEGESGVYITPTLRHARCCMMAGADIVALDATSRPRPDGRTLRQTVDVLKEEGAVLMADCSCLDDALQAADLGFDFISTTLAGYTGAGRCPTSRTGTCWSPWWTDSQTCQSFARDAFIHPGKRGVHVTSEPGRWWWVPPSLIRGV